MLGGRYRLDQRLGSGGEGETFRVLDERTQTRLALKLFRAVGAEITTRVQIEFERLMALDHPGLVKALDVGRHEGRLFLVTELLAGDSIAQIARVPDEERGVALFTRAARELADALAYLHGRGVVHGDVSPENVRIANDGRAVLIDVGAPRGASEGGARGTLGFAAPEALIGRLTPATDLFGLGATLFKSWSGAAPFGEGADAVSRMLSRSAPAPLLSSVRPGLPPVWDRLIGALLERQPEHRWSSARSLLRELGPVNDGVALLPPYPAGDPLGGILVGRAAERSLLMRELDRLAEGVSAYAAIALVGVAGSGRRTLAAWTLRDLAIAQLGESAAPLTVFRGPLAALGTWLGLADIGPKLGPDLGPDLDQDALRVQQRAFARIASGLEVRGRDRPLLVALAEGAEEQAFSTFVAGAPASGRWLILLPSTRPLARVASLDVSLPPFGTDDVRELVVRASEGAADGPGLDDRAVQSIIRGGAGHPATTAVLARQLVAAVRRGEADRFVPKPDLALDALLAQSLDGLPHPARRLVAAVGLGLTVVDSAEGTDDARAAGWIVETPDAASGMGLPSVAHRLVLQQAFPDAPDLREVAREALGSSEPPPEPIRAACLEALGRCEEAAARYRAAAAGHASISRELAGWNGSGEAAAWLEEAARLSPRSLDAAQRIFLVNRMVAQGRGAEALSLLDCALAADPPQPDDLLTGGEWLQLVERKAWLLGRAGELAAARRLLDQTLAHLPGDAPADLVELARTRLARVLVSLGLFAEAILAIAPCRSDSPSAALAGESALLAHAYRGDLTAARGLLATPSWSALPRPRARYLAALLDQLAGDLRTALEGYRQALPEAEASGDIHTLAAIALNMGALAAEAGRHDEALAMHDRAIRELGRLGSPSELAVALFNAGMLLIELGDLAGARQIVARLRHESPRPVPSDGPVASSSAALAYLEAELAWRAGDEPGALTLFTRASAAGGLESTVVFPARIARAELLARRGQHEQAVADLDELANLALDARARSELRLARARIGLGRGGGSGGLLASPADALRLASELEADAAGAARSGRYSRAWRSSLTAARLFHRLGHSTQAADAATTASRLFQEIRMSTPVDRQAGLESDPDARFLADLARLTSPTSPTSPGRGNDGSSSSSPPSSSSPATPWAARASRTEDRLRRLLRVNKRLNSELRLPRLLELIMDTVIELTEAERGFILLEDDKGELTVKVARNIDQQTLESDAFQISGSIARQAASGGTPIVTIDAAGDPRFREALSVFDLHLRSVLAVPLQAKGRAVGTLYVDNRLRKGAFGEDDVQLVLDFAEQAGIAVENARLMAEVRRRERQIEVLNRRLQGELAVRKEELFGMRQELRENREALAIRYDYRNIIGRTPRMLDLFRLLDRLTDTTLPVVIQGESGTGKELVARALHFNGLRRDRPFVSENCAAIPETLLESTLFGTVKGAFTGAEHDTRGLFEVADGGTLFLDEVGEMSPAMQGKLLRVLQLGELRRVGSERTRKVDVRVIAATNRDLARMVEEGRFRQDLFFRLSVASITLPPLRERREDIPAMVEHILKKLGATTKDTGIPKQVEPSALARLIAYRWPGNVRELENELMRAAAMSDQHIGVPQLSPQIAGEAETALGALDDPDNLSLRPRVERLERALLREALSRTGGNQTRAAVALGLSRFGLQKKLHRYRMGA